MTTWILSAQRSGARIFVHKRGDGLTLHREIPHAEGRLRDGNIDTDKSGRVVGGNGRGHAMEHRESPSERVAADFARSLARTLEQGRVRGSFDSLILVASPQMLGLLRKSLDSATAGKVNATIDKEYSVDNQDKLERALSEYIRI